MSGEMWLTRVPSNQEISSALDQDEGILFKTDSGEELSFVPRNRLYPGHQIQGFYYVYNNGKLTNRSGSAILYLADLDTPEPVASIYLQS